MHHWSKLQAHCVAQRQNIHDYVVYGIISRNLFIIFCADSVPLPSNDWAWRAVCGKDRNTNTCPVWSQANNVCSIDTPQTEKTEVRYQKTKEIDMNSLPKEMLELPFLHTEYMDVNQLVEAYNESLATFVDRHAPEMCILIYSC